MSGQEIGLEVAAAIAEASAETGNSVPLTGEIVRTSGADESVYPPTPGQRTSYSCSLLFVNYTASDRVGTQITERDVKILIPITAETDPRNGDELVVDGKTYHLENVEPVQPGGEVLLWECRARSAND